MRNCTPSLKPCLSITRARSILIEHEDSPFARDCRRKLNKTGSYAVNAAKEFLGPGDLHRFGRSLSNQLRESIILTSVDRKNMGFFLFGMVPGLMLTDRLWFLLELLPGNAPNSMMGVNKFWNGLCFRTIEKFTVCLDPSISLYSQIDEKEMSCASRGGEDEF